MEKRFEPVVAEVVSAYDVVEVDVASIESLQKTSCDPPCQ